MNLNDYVWVRLKPSGLERLKAIHDELATTFPRVGQWQPPKMKNGWYRQQLWCLFQDFGPVIGLGVESPFEDNEIRLTAPEEA